MYVLGTVGLMGVAGAAGGNILGAVISKKANLTPIGILKMCCGVCVAAIVLTATLIAMWCDPPGEVGVSVEYPNG